MKVLRTSPIVLIVTRKERLTFVADRLQFVVINKSGENEKIKGWGRGADTLTHAHHYIPPYSYRILAYEYTPITLCP